jgi:predicted permease
MNPQDIGFLLLLFLAVGVAFALIWLVWIRIFMKWEGWRNRAHPNGNNVKR